MRVNIILLMFLISTVTFSQEVRLLHTKVSSANWGESIKLETNITNAHLVNYIIISYKTDLEQHYSQIEMNPFEGKFVAEIPPTNENYTKISYYIEIFDANEKVVSGFASAKDPQTIKIERIVDVNGNNSNAITVQTKDKDIKFKTDSSDFDIFRDLPGFDISENVEGEVRTLVTGRGLSGNNKIMVLLDGKKLNTTTGERFVYGNNIPLFNIKQIEIIYGPSSAMYGADAYAGVINMISKSPEDINGFAADFFYDTNQTFNESIILSKKVNDSFSISLDARKYDSEGIDVTNFSEYKTNDYKLHNDNFNQPTNNYNIYTKVKFNDFTVSNFNIICYQII